MFTDTASLAAFLVEVAKRPQSPADAARVFTEKVLRRVAEALQTNDADNSLQADLDLFQVEFEDSLRGHP